MKRLFMLVMFLGILISDASSFGEGEFAPPAGDRLKVTEIKPVRSLELGGNDWGFKITIVNEDNIKSSGRSFDAVVKLRSGGSIIRTKTITIAPPKLSPGSSWSVTFNISSLTENQVVEGVFSIVMDTVQDALTGMTKEFRLRNP